MDPTLSHLPDGEGDWQLVSSGSGPSSPRISNEAPPREGMNANDVGIAHVNNNVDFSVTDEPSLPIDIRSARQVLPAESLDHAENPFDTEFGNHARTTQYLKDFEAERAAYIRNGGLKVTANGRSFMSHEVPGHCNVGFPPPPSALHQLTTNGYRPQPEVSSNHFRTPVVSTNNVDHSPNMNLNRNNEAQNSIGNPSLGVDLPATGIPSREERELAIRNFQSVNSPYGLLDPRALLTDSLSKEVKDFCRKCKEFHIEVGEAETLPERDTCGSYVPDWHRSVDPNKPWAGLKILYRTVIEYYEAEFGHCTSTGEHIDHVTASHPPHPKWRPTTYPVRGGNWQCRSVHSAPQTERLCTLCHPPMLEPTRLHGPPVKRLLAEWLLFMLKYVGLPDKDIAAAILHRMEPATMQSLVQDFTKPAWTWTDFAEFDDYYESTNTEVLYF